MRRFGDLVQRVANYKGGAAVALSLSVVLPLVMYQTAVWRMEAASYAGRLEHATALKAVSELAVQHIKEWSEAKKRMPLPGAGASAPAGAANRTTQMGVNIESQRMSRVGADQVLEGLAQNTDGLFVPEAFLIRATKPGDGLFARNVSEDLPDSLTLTIKGEFVSRDLQ